MERLTIHNSDGSVSQPTSTTIQAVFEKLAAYEDTGLEPREVKAKCAWADKMYKTLSDIFGDSGVFDFSHFKELSKAEQEGRLVVLPCKVGDTVYQKDHCGEIYEAVVQSIVIDKRRTIFITSGIGFDETAIGKTVFLSRAEAEAALKGVSEDALS